MFVMLFINGKISSKRITSDNIFKNITLIEFNVNKLFSFIFDAYKYHFKHQTLQIVLYTILKRNF